MKTTLTEQQISSLMLERIDLATLYSRLSNCDTIIAKSNIVGSVGSVGELKLDTEVKLVLNDFIVKKIRRIDEVLGIESKFTTK